MKAVVVDGPHQVAVRDVAEPVCGPKDVIIRVAACGICGSDVHMAQADKDGYIFYPGLTGFPSILGHELSGVVVEWGKKAYDKNTNKPFKGGEAVTTEEMLWCGNCKPCADGYPNHCERSIKMNRISLWLAAFANRPR